MWRGEGGWRRGGEGGLGRGDGQRTEKKKDLISDNYLAIANQFIYIYLLGPVGRQT